MARIFSNYTPGATKTLISPPESFSLFPSLAKTVKQDATDSDAIPDDLNAPVESRLDPSATFMIAIEAKETAGAKMTMANAVLERCASLASLVCALWSARPLTRASLALSQPGGHDLAPRTPRQPVQAGVKRLRARTGHPTPLFLFPRVSIDFPSSFFCSGQTSSLSPRSSPVRSSS